MIELFSDDRKILKALNIPKEEVCVWSCVEGMMGRAWINDMAAPAYGIVAVADFLFLLGHPPNELSEPLRNLIEQYGKNQIIVSEELRWDNAVWNAFPDCIVRFKRYAFHWEPDVFDQNMLSHYANGEGETFKVVPFDLELSEKALENNFTADFCMFFESPEAFLKQGIGFCVVDNQQIVAGASSYSACDGAIDITIGTVDRYRRKGLALKCAAKLILACIDRGVYPRWDAANPESVALAQKLGYRLKGAYEVFTIKGECK